jgi:ATP-binding cassette, subfamily B, bacterial HlyB/CyaB
LNQNLLGKTHGEPITHSGLRALCGIGAYYRIAADPLNLARDLAIFDCEASENDLLRAAKTIGLKAHIVRGPSRRRLARVPTPAILRLKSGDYCLLTGPTPSGRFRIVDPLTRIARELTVGDLVSEIEPVVILVARQFLGAGVDPRSFGFRWFAPSLWRYRKPLFHVLIASFFVQIFALVSPLFFQVVIDKVLTHRGYSTLFVLVGGLAGVGVFDVVLQYLRTYALSHTTNRIDVELGRRLFRHLARLPVSYFETRANRPDGRAHA